MKFELSTLKDQFEQGAIDNTNNLALPIPIKALFVYNSNPDATAPDRNKVIAGVEHNSNCANLPQHLRMEREPLLEIHPTNAAQRRITEGEWVQVFNDRGKVKIRARVGDRVRPSVVSMPSGWWASLSSGGTANALTAAGLSDWGNGGDFYDTLVEVKQCDELEIDGKSHIKN